jgi:hypothetical protein
MIEKKKICLITTAIPCKFLSINVRYQEQDKQGQHFNNHLQISSSYSGKLLIMIVYTVMDAKIAFFILHLTDTCIKLVLSRPSSDD